MDRNERREDLQTALLAALRGERADIWTALPGIVQSYDAATQTVVVQPTVRARIDSPAYTSATVARDPSGYAWDQLPLLLDCPVVFPSGGGVTLTFPVAAGDECLVVFASRCIDGWWQTGQVSNPPVMRMHDLSDGFALVGVRSTPRMLTGVSTSKAQLRNDGGDTYVELDPVAQSVKIVAPGGINLNGATIDATGRLTSEGKVLGTHTHPLPGGGNTGEPN